METILDIVKNHVSVPEGAAYCLGMTDGYPTEISCPCHNDEDASMQLYDNHYHCPVCGATGDVTDLVAKKMHVSKITAAASLAHAFSVPLPVSVDDETADDLLASDGVTSTFYRVLTMYSGILKIIKKKSDTRKPEQLTWLDFYTAGQVKAIVQQAVELALQKHLDNSIPQLSPTITVAEAAEILRISKPSMYDLIRSGQVHSIRVGKKILVSRQSMIDWVEGRKQ